MGIVYKATNTVNGKAYIGFDSKWPKRKREHINKSIIGGEHFHNAIAKHGADKFQWEIILEDATYDDEIRLIEEHGTYGNGYNLTKGGEGKLGYKTSDETKRKISEAAKKREVTPERLATLRNNARIMKETGHTEEVKQRISEAHRGKPKTDAHRKALSDNHAAKRETGAFYKSAEYKEKMSKATKGKVRTSEQRERYRQAALNRKKKTNV